MSLSRFYFWAPCFYMALIPFSEPYFIWDEAYHINLARDFNATGLSLAFLRNMQVAMGPAYGMFLALTGLASQTSHSLHFVRFINCILLGGCLFLLQKLAQALKTENTISKLVYLGVPIFGLMSLFAMSDIPALFVFLLSLFLWTESQKEELSPVFKVTLIILAGLIFGISATIRQTYLVGLSGFFFLGLRKDESRSQVFLFVLFALLLPIMLFGAWGGLVPPKIRLVEQARGHFSMTHLWLALSQSGIVISFLFPSILLKSLRKNLLILFLFLLCTPIFKSYLISDLSERLPLRFFFQKVLGQWHPLVATWILVASFAVGFIFLWDCLSQFFKAKQALLQCFWISGIALILCSALVAHNYSSRYPLPGIVLICLLASKEYRKFDFWFGMRVVMGAAIGLTTGAYYLRVF